MSNQLSLQIPKSLQERIDYHKQTTYIKYKEELSTAQIIRAALNVYLPLVPNDKNSSLRQMRKNKVDRTK